MTLAAAPRSLDPQADNTRTVADAQLEIEHADDDEGKLSHHCPQSVSESLLERPLESLRLIEHHQVNVSRHEFIRVQS